MLRCSERLAATSRLVSRFSLLFSAFVVELIPRNFVASAVVNASVKIVSSKMDTVKINDGAAVFEGSDVQALAPVSCSEEWRQTAQ